MVAAMGLKGQPSAAEMELAIEHRKNAAENDAADSGRQDSIRGFFLKGRV
jgi:hypothetical protein